MKELVVMEVRKLLPNDGDKCAMIHVTHMVVVDPWFGCPFMKWYFDGNCSLGPASAFKWLIWSHFLSLQLCIDGVPVCATDILWLKFRGTNNLYELLESFFGLLYSAIPVPVSEEKRRYVRVWIETCDVSTVNLVLGRVINIHNGRSQSKVLQCRCDLWIVRQRLMTIIPTGKPKAIGKCCEEPKHTGN